MREVVDEVFETCDIAGLELGVAVVFELDEDKRDCTLLDEVAAIYLVSLLVEEVVFLEEAGNEARADPGKELLLDI